MNAICQLKGSATELQASDVGSVAIVGSHGGTEVGKHALRCGVSALIFHDAGVGRELAGIASLQLLDEYDIPAAGVSHRSAKIGDTGDMLANGKLSFLNETARRYSLKPEMSVEAALEILRTNVTVMQTCAHINGDGFSRFELSRVSKLNGTSIRVIALDSASSISEQDQNLIVVTGSHGGVPGGDIARAIKFKPRFVVFNDAGIGIADAGTARLRALDELNVPAACVDCWTSRIGDARSTFETGIISVANQTALNVGVTAGQAVKLAIQQNFSNRGWLPKHDHERNKKNV